MSATKQAAAHTTRDCRSGSGQNEFSLSTQRLQSSASDCRLHALVRANSAQCQNGGQGHHLVEGRPGIDSSDVSHAWPSFGICPHVATRTTSAQSTSFVLGRTNACASTPRTRLVRLCEEVDNAGVVVIPCGNDDFGNPIVDPPVIQTPAMPVPTVAPGSTPGAGTGSGPDPSAALLQGALAARQVMTQVHLQSDKRNASVSQQQAKLQAAALQSQAQQLEHLTHHLGSLGYEVGRAIASHPTQHSHTIQAALSHPNAVAGQSTDPRVLGSLTRAIPVGMSVSNFDYGPCAQAFQPQPNDKNMRRVDEATHQIMQQSSPDTVKDRYDAAHASGVVLPMSDCLNGFVHAIETEVDKLCQIVRKFFWHPSLGTGCITSSGFVLQPNIQERDFAQCAPHLKNLDPSTVRMFHVDLCRVAHDHGIYMPAREEHRPEETFSRIECNDSRTACVPKFCQSQVQRWEAVVHHHLKQDKVIPSTHPQANEIKHNPNGYEALMLLICPYHPGFTENGILIKPHPQQGKRSLEDHFRRCEFCCCGQECHLGARHNWDDPIHMICFLNSCQNSGVLHTLCDQERHVPTMQCKFMRERIVAALKEHMASPSFTLLGGRNAAGSTATNSCSAPTAAVTSLTTRPAGSNTRHRYRTSSGRWRWCAAFWQSWQILS